MPWGEPKLNKPDNITIDGHGNLLIQGDPGGNKRAEGLFGTPGAYLLGAFLIGAQVHTTKTYRLELAGAPSKNWSNAASPCA